MPRFHYLSILERNINPESICQAWLFQRVLPPTANKPKLKVPAATKSIAIKVTEKETTLTAAQRDAKTTIEHPLNSSSGLDRSDSSSRSFISLFVDPPLSRHSTTLVQQHLPGPHPCQQHLPVCPHIKNSRYVRKRACIN